LFAMELRDLSGVLRTLWYLVPLSKPAPLRETE
jgi:hypothetical protein